MFSGEFRGRATGRSSSSLRSPNRRLKKRRSLRRKSPPSLKRRKEPQIITVVLKVHMHCEACAQEIKKRILRMKGVESVEPDLKSSEVRVKGVFDPAKLVEYVYKRTGKHAAIVKQEPEKEKEETKDDDSKEEKKADEDGGGDKGNKGDDQEKNKEMKGGDEESNSKPDSEGGAAMEEEINEVVELQKNAYYYYPQRYAMEMHAYPPQIFSDENPNACSIM
ncbi:hypothetical protein I3760_12G003900 [Carya illinoinensis]|nr:hypothetical protein I3760_12G003900 [Carya illinoinensis]KAG2675420.1 hypothetical protein I3760_12G003900 [Carya illinoinensis]